MLFISANVVNSFILNRCFLFNECIVLGTRANVRLINWKPFGRSVALCGPCRNGTFLSDLIFLLGDLFLDSLLDSLLDSFLLRCRCSGGRRFRVVFQVLVTPEEVQVAMLAAQSPRAVSYCR